MCGDYVVFVGVAALDCVVGVPRWSKSGSPIVQLIVLVVVIGQGQGHAFKSV